MDQTADRHFLKRIDARVKQREPEHVEFNSTSGFRELYTQAGLTYIAARWIAYPIKAHLGQKR